MTTYHVSQKGMIRGFLRFVHAQFHTSMSEPGSIHANVSGATALPTRFRSANVTWLLWGWCYVLDRLCTQSEAMHGSIHSYVSTFFHIASPSFFGTRDSLWIG